MRSLQRLKSTYIFIRNMERVCTSNDLTEGCSQENYSALISDCAEKLTVDWSEFKLCSLIH